MKPFTALLGAAAGSHAADQLALAALPLTAALALGANGATIGLLMAAQSAAWLLVSLPAGAWIDRASRRRLLAGAQAMGMAGALVALIAAEAGMAWLLGLGAFLSASATVIYVLGSVSILPGLVPAADLPRANARIELVRAAVSLAAPVSSG
ncbi:MAG: MFS transporter [Alphaproteobacteria bacterium]|nr:MFS transporter [Alphaproteobacteria bacterium]